MSRGTREQRIVSGLSELVWPPGAEHEAKLSEAQGRAQSLPSMLRRHGPVQTLLFLAAKGHSRNSDLWLGQWLIAGIRSALDLSDPQAPETLHKSNPGDYATWLAGQPGPAYMLRWEAALQAAGWIKMLIEARAQVHFSVPTSANHSEESPA